MAMKQKQWIRIIIIWLVYLNARCVEQGWIPTPKNLVNTSTPTPSSDTLPAISKVSPTHVLQQPILTVTPALRFTTPISQITLSADELKTTVFELLKKNGNCQLPCLWGFIPGETDIVALNQFITQIGNLTTPDIYVRVQDFGDVGGFFLSHRKNNIHTIVDLSFYIKGNNKLDLLILSGYAMQEIGKDLDWLSPEVSPLYGNASFNQAFEYYLLPQILSNYGPPGQVLLAPFPDDPDRADITWHPFSLVLYYPARGIFVEYVSTRDRVGNNYVGCPSKVSLSLAVWSPESDLTFKDIVRKAGAEINELNMEYFKPVEAATALTLDEFYRIFKNPQNTTCLETPISVWQAP